MAFTRQQVHQLYSSYGHVVFHRCRALLQDEQEAREMTQEVFVRVLTSQNFRGEASPLTWLYRISTHLCLNRLRDARTRQRHLDTIGAHLAQEEEGAPDGFPTSSRLPGAREAERRALLRTLLARADEQTQAVVVLTFFDDLTQEEVADILEISVPTVRKRLAHFEAISRRTLSIEGAALGALVVAALIEGGLPWS